MGSNKDFKGKLSYVTVTENRKLESIGLRIVKRQCGIQSGGII